MRDVRFVGSGVSKQPWRLSKSAHYIQEVGSHKKEYHQDHLSLCLLFKDWPDYLSLQSVYSVSKELTGSHSTHKAHENDGGGGSRGPPG